MVNNLYRGYSSVANTGIQTKLTDVELVKQDLLNNFNTRIDERVGRPRFGSIIHDLLFNLSDSRTEALIVQDAIRIISSDPRVQLLSIIPNTDLDRGQITLNINIRIIEFNMDDWFSVTFRENS